MAAAEDLCRGLVCSMLLFCVVASLWCIVNAIAVAIRDQAISIAVESFAAMGNQQPSGQRSVSGNDISELASGLSQLAMAFQRFQGTQSGGSSRRRCLSCTSFPSFSSWSWSFLSCLPTWPWAAPGPVSATMPLLQASCLLEGGHLCQ